MREFVIHSLVAVAVGVLLIILSIYLASSPVDVKQLVVDPFSYMTLSYNLDRGDVLRIRATGGLFNIEIRGPGGSVLFSAYFITSTTRSVEAFERGEYTVRITNFGLSAVRVETEFVRKSFSSTLLYAGAAFIILGLVLAALVSYYHSKERQQTPWR